MNRRNGNSTIQIGSCCLPFFWRNILNKVIFLSQKIQELPENTLHKIALNFGLWETGTAIDHRALDCHGHAHVELRKDAAVSLSKVLKVLEGRLNPPEDYRNKNCVALETERVLGQEVRQINDKIDMINQTVLSIEEKFNLMMQHLQIKPIAIKPIAKKKKKKNKKVEIIMDTKNLRIEENQFEENKNRWWKKVNEINWNQNFPSFGNPTEFSIQLGKCQTSENEEEYLEFDSADEILI